MVVVGAGPSGSAVSRWIAEEGFTVLLAEQHQQVGHPNHCAGLVTPRTLKLADLSSDSLVQNELKGAIVRSLSGRELPVGGNRVHALAVDRPLLDAKLARAAQAAGARLALGNRAWQLERDDGCLRVGLQNRHQHTAVTTRLVIGADGAGSKVGRWAGLGRPTETVRAINARVKLDGCISEFVEVFVGPSVAPGWFAWIIPEGNGEARLGIGATRGSPTSHLKNLMAAFPDRFRGAEILEVSTWLIPLGLPQHICTDNVMLVGDAACQVKPTSGGGIYTGLLGARLCARAAVRALRNDDLSAESLRRYHASWLERMGDELRLGMFLRRLFTQLGDDDFDRLLQLLSHPPLQRTISKHGDIDYPSRLFEQLASALVVPNALSTLSAHLGNPHQLVKDVIGILRRST